MQTLLLSWLEKNQWKARDSVFTVALPTSFPFYKSILPVLACWGLAYDSTMESWVAVLCWSKINTFFLEKYLVVYLFQVLIWWPVPEKSPEGSRAAEQGFGIHDCHTVTHYFLANPELWRYFFLLDLSSCFLCIFYLFEDLYTMQLWVKISCKFKRSFLKKLIIKPKSKPKLTINIIYLNKILRKPIFFPVFTSIKYKP